MHTIADTAPASRVEEALEPLDTTSPAPQLWSDIAGPNSHETRLYVSALSPSILGPPQIGVDAEADRSQGFVVSAGGITCCSTDTIVEVSGCTGRPSQGLWLDPPWRSLILANTSPGR